MDSYTSYTVMLDPVENEAGFPTEIMSTYFETGMHVGLSEKQTGRYSFSTAKPCY